MVDEPEPPTVPQEQPAEPRAEELLDSIRQPTCDLCGSRMIEWHCRILCPMCGYQRDCSDP